MNTNIETIEQIITYIEEHTYKDLEKEEQKVFDYYAGVEVSKADSI